jgi:hypothetical protein
VAAGRHVGVGAGTRFGEEGKEGESVLKCDGQIVGRTKEGADRVCWRMVRRAHFQVAKFLA